MDKLPGNEKILKFLQGNGVEFSQNFGFPDLTDANGNYLVYDFALYDKKRRFLVGLIDHTEKYFEDSNEFANVIGVSYKQLDEDDKLKNYYCSSRGIQLEQLTRNQDGNIYQILKNFMEHITPYGEYNIDISNMR